MNRAAGMRDEVSTNGAVRGAGLAPLVGQSAKRGWRGWLNRQRRRGLQPTRKGALLALVHLGILALAYAISVEMAQPRGWADGGRELFWSGLPGVLAIELLCLYAAGWYRGWWRHASLADLVALALGVGLAWGVLELANWLAAAPRIPHGVLLVNAALALLLVGGFHVAGRLIHEQVLPWLGRSSQREALMVGADDSHGLLAHQVRAHGQAPFRICGFLDPDPARLGSRLGDIPILGGLDEVREVAAAYGVHDIVVMVGTLPAAQLRQLVERCDEAGLELHILPAIEDLFNGNRRIPIRNVDTNDLLHRPPAELDAKAIGLLIRDRMVMVTGGGGSIGSEICRQVARFRPKVLLIVEKGENNLFLIEQELRRTMPEVALQPLIADITDEARMRQLFGRYQPEVIFHAAAHKHVTMMEWNIGEAVKNNIGGTKLVADLADEFGALSFVFISTDKAVNPTSVMGATKQIAERYVHALSQDSATRFAVVRFGNVLASAGSVIPIFQEQIRRGGPITITDARMERFFMTIPEAAQLVLQAAATCRGGEIFVLQMGQPIKIVDFARDLVRLAGLPPHAIDFVYTGLRPGEKITEELYLSDEHTLPTSHPKVRAAYHRPYPLAEVCEAIAELKAIVHEPEPLIRQKLGEIVKEYKPTPGAAAAPAAAASPTAAPAR